VVIRKEFNSLDRTEPVLTFKTKRHDVHTIIVSAVNDDGVWLPSAPQVILSLSHNTIQVKIKTRILFVLEHRWNIETLDCNLVIDNKTWSLSQVSQMAVGDLLFDNLPEFE